VRAAVGPRMGLLELRRQANELSLRADAADELDTDREPIGSPVPRDGHGGTASDVRQLGVGHPTEVVGDAPLDKRRDPAQKPRSARQQPLGGHPQRGLVAPYRFFDVVNLAGTVSRPRPPGGERGPLAHDGILDTWPMNPS